MISSVKSLFLSVIVMPFTDILRIFWPHILNGSVVSVDISIVIYVVIPLGVKAVYLFPSHFYKGRIIITFYGDQSAEQTTEQFIDGPGCIFIDICAKQKYKKTPVQPHQKDHQRGKTAIVGFINAAALDEHGKYVGENSPAQGRKNSA